MAKKRDGRVIRVGVISDTHGLLRPEALRLLRGAAHIVHAGDIGDPTILDELSKLAPVTAVRGNNDRERWARAVPERAELKVGAVAMYVLHNLAELEIDPAGRYRVVIAGHSHKPLIEERDGVLYVNPGSAGPPRFSLPIALGELRVAGASVRAMIRNLQTK
ncbi:MAG: metallophosphoesterase family protein [Burkholderiales bacterium]